MPDVGMSKEAVSVSAMPFFVFDGVGHRTAEMEARTFVNDLESLSTEILVVHPILNSRVPL